MICSKRTDPLLNQIKTKSEFIFNFCSNPEIDQGEEGSVLKSVVDLALFIMNISPFFHSDKRLYQGKRRT